MAELPLISALMPFSRPGRRQLARLSVRSFLDQSWPRKELVIFNATKQRLTWFPHRAIKEIRLRARPQPKMLELCWENCTGSWGTLWWDDCVYERDYLSYLAAQARPGTLVMLQNKTLFDKGLNRAFTTDNPHIVCPLFPRGPLDFSNDMASHFPLCCTLHNDPSLVVKVVRVLHEPSPIASADCPAGN